MQTCLRIPVTTALVLLTLQLSAQQHSPKIAARQKKTMAVTQKTGTRPGETKSRWNMVAEANAPVTTVKIKQPDGTILEENWKILPADK